jgi:hypothetical protein
MSVEILLLELRIQIPGLKFWLERRRRKQRIRQWKAARKKPASTAVRSLPDERI